jgi:hypothetical protein
VLLRKRLGSGDLAGQAVTAVLGHDAQVADDGDQQRLQPFEVGALDGTEDQAGLPEL